MGPDPAFVDGVNGEGVEVVPALAAAALGDDQVGGFQHLQMLHHRAAVEVRELRAQTAGGQRLIAQHVEDGAAMMGGEGAEHTVLLLDQAWNL